MILILDTNLVANLIVDPNKSQKAKECQNWILDKYRQQDYLVFPEICEYEIRRGIEYRKLKSSNKYYKDNILNQWIDFFELSPLTNEVLTEASKIWAELKVKSFNRPKGVDVDVLIHAHYKLTKNKFPGREIFIVTDNTKDFNFNQKIIAKPWTDIL